jgi:hypothetical protein
MMGIDGYREPGVGERVTEIGPKFGGIGRGRAGLELVGGYGCLGCGIVDLAGRDRGGVNIGAGGEWTG